MRALSWTYKFMSMPTCIIIIIVGVAGLLSMAAARWLMNCVSKFNHNFMYFLFLFVDTLCLKA